MSLSFVSGQKAIAASVAADNVCVVSYPSNVTAGNLLVCTTNQGFQGTHQLADNLGDSVPWVEHVSVDSAGGRRSKQWSKVAGVSGACTVTATFPDSQARRCVTVREFTENHASPFDQANSNTATSATFQSGSVTMTADGCLVSGFSSDGGNTTDVLDSDYVEMLEETVNGRHGSAHRITAAITDECVNTWSASNNWLGTICSYKTAGAATLGLKGGGNSEEFMKGKRGIL